MHYKYIVVRHSDGAVLRWQEGPNNVLHLQPGTLVQVRPQCRVHASARHALLCVPR